MHPGAPERHGQHHRPPPRRSRRTGTRSTRPVRDGERVWPPPTGDASRGTGRASRTAVPLPGTTVPGAGVMGLDPRACRYRRRRPPVPTCSCGGTGGLSRYIPRSAMAYRGLPADRVRRTSAPRHAGAPGERRGARRAPPRGTRTSCPRGSTAGGTRRGCARGTARAYVRPRYVESTRYTMALRGDVPRPEPSDLFDVQHRRRPPGGYRRVPVLPAGEPGARTAAGDSPAPAYRSAGAAGSDRQDVPPAPVHPRRHRRYGIPTGARPCTGRSYAPGAPTGDVPGAPPAVLGDRSPGYTTPAGDRDLAPRHDAVPSGNEFLMFLNPFPPVGGGVRRPVQPREQGVRGPYRYEFAG